MEKIFDHYIVVDWSASEEPGPSHRKPDRLKKNCIWVGEGPTDATEHYFRTRARAAAFLQQRLEALVQDGKRVFVGFDFAFGYPAGFAKALTGKAGWTHVWKYLVQHLSDDELNENNRFDLAAQMNAKLEGEGPFWGLPRDTEIEGMTAKSPWKGVDELTLGGHTLQRMRITDADTKGAQEVWQLYGAGSVGGQTLTGIPVVWALRQSEALKSQARIWPFETTLSKKADYEKTKVVFAEVFPSLADDRVREMARDEREAPKDQLQVRALVAELAEADQKNELFAWFFEATSMPEQVLKEEAAILKPPAALAEANSSTPDKESAKMDREERKAQQKAEREAKRAERERLREEKKAQREAERAKKKEDREKKKKDKPAKKEKPAKEAKKVKEKKEKKQTPAPKRKVKTPEGDTIEVTEAMKGYNTETAPDPDVLDQLMGKEEE